MSREFYYEEEDQGDPIIVDELLNGLNDWRSVPDIVRLTFKALSDLMKSHTSTLRELEIQIATKANRSELVQKANLTDLNRFVSDFKSTSDTKSMETIYTLLEDRATKKECQYLINSKVNELKSELDKKIDYRDFQSELLNIKTSAGESSIRKTHSREIDNIYKLLEEKASISDVNAALEDKVSKHSLASALNKKVSRIDIESLMLSKADLSELQSMLSLVESKADRHSLESLAREMSEKLDRSELQKLMREDFFKKSDSETPDNVIRIKRDLEYKLNQFDKYIESLRLNIEQTQATLSEEIANKFVGGDTEYRTEITKINSHLRSEIKKNEEKYNEKVMVLDSRLKQIFEEINDLKSRLFNLLGKLDEKDRSSKYSESGLEHFKQELRVNLNKDLEKVFREISNNKSYIDNKIKEIGELVDEKPSKFEINNLISESKAHRIFIEETEQIKKSIEFLSKKNFSEIYEILDSFRAELTDKVGNQDLLNLLRKKPDIEDIKEIMSKATDDKAVIETLCAENCTGRWLWKSGDVRAGYTIPWEIQSVNTCPENFIWEKDSVSIITVTPGLYEIFFSFFTSKKPSIQLLVNGEAVVIETLGENKAWGRHRDGNIIGASLTDYIALPSRARICISYSGPRIVEGFLSLRKL